MIGVGSDKIGKVLVGADEIGKIFVGSDLVYENGTWEDPTLVGTTLTIPQSYSASLDGAALSIE